MSDSCSCYWPAEWEPHDATWIAWPHNSETWPHNLSAAQDEMEQLIRLLAEHETVRLLVGRESLPQITSRSIDTIDNLEIWPIATNDAWIRDYGPTVVNQVEQSGFQVIDWNYNSWGKKYPPYDLDQQIVARCAELMRCERRIANGVMEGGAIEGNGKGVLLTTESCLFHPQRNPDSTKAQFEAMFRDLLSTKTVVWLPGGDLVGDDTDGHIDQIARFVDEDLIVISSESNSDDDNYHPLLRNREVLQSQLDQINLVAEIVELPMPTSVEYRSVRLPASYANFIWINDLVVVPQFDDRNDQRAIGILSDLIPEREVIGLGCRNLVVGLGSWHCLTQQHCRAI